VSAAAPGGSPLRDEQGFEEFYAAVFGRLVGQLYVVTGDRGPTAPSQFGERSDQIPKGSA
jgi:hypothetical protein